MQFPFKCSSTFALAMKSQKNVGWLGPLDVIEYNTHCLQPGPVPGLVPTSKLEQAAQGHILLSFEYLQGLRYPSLHGTFSNVSPPSLRKYFSQQLFKKHPSYLVAKRTRAFLRCSSLPYLSEAPYHHQYKFLPLPYHYYSYPLQRQVCEPFSTYNSDIVHLLDGSSESHSFCNWIEITA